MGIDILFVRHGQTDWNSLSKVMGHLPTPLNARGLEQAHYLKEWLKDIEVHAIYTSPMLRTKQTAEIIGQNYPSLKIQEEEGVAEIQYGDWVGLTFAELVENYPKEYHDYRFAPSNVKIPGGEKISQVRKRGVEAIERIRKNHKGQRVVVVSHADVIKAMIGHYLNLPLDWLQRVGCDNGSISIFRFGTDWGDRLVALNYFADVKKILPW